MNTMKEKLNKVAVAGLAAGIPTALYAFPVYASDTSTDVTAPLIEACKSMADSATKTISGVIPIALPLVGAGLVIVIGLKVFKRIAGKA